MRQLFLCLSLVFALSMTTACGEDDILYNRLANENWDIAEYTRETYDDLGELTSTQLITNYGWFSFDDDGFGWFHFNEGTYFVEGELQWLNDDDEVILILQGFTDYYEVLTNRSNEQVWRTRYDYDDGSFDYVYMRLLR